MARIEVNFDPCSYHSGVLATGGSWIECGPNRTCCPGRTSRPLSVHGDPSAFTESPETRKERAIEAVNKALGKPLAEQLAEREIEKREYVTGVSPPTYAGAYWTAGRLMNEQSGDLTKSAFHMTVAGGHCGDVECAKCDPMERYVDGLSARECMLRWEANRAVIEGNRPLASLELLTDAQIVAGKAAHQTMWGPARRECLRALVREAAEDERNRVVCDWQDEA
jgi:hypothetical protein